MISCGLRCRLFTDYRHPPYTVRPLLTVRLRALPFNSEDYSILLQRYDDEVANPDALASLSSTPSFVRTRSRMLVQIADSVFSPLLCNLLLLKATIHMFFEPPTNVIPSL